MYDPRPHHRGPLRGLRRPAVARHHRHEHYAPLLSYGRSAYGSIILPQRRHAQVHSPADHARPATLGTRGRRSTGTLVVHRRGHDRRGHSHRSTAGTPSQGPRRRGRRLASTEPGGSPRRRVRLHGGQHRRARQDLHLHPKRGLRAQITAARLGLWQGGAPQPLSQGRRRRRPRRIGGATTPTSVPATNSHTPRQSPASHRHRRTPRHT